MTQQEEAEALCNLAATKGQHPGINAKMVSNWERGIQTPSKENRALLIEYFGRSAEALGLDQPSLDQPPQGCPLAPLLAYAGFAVEPPAADDEALFGAGALATAGTGEGATTKRRTVLKAIGGGLSSLVLGARSAATADSVELTRQLAGNSTTTLEQLNLVVERLGLTYLSTPPAEVFDEAHHYRQIATQLLKEHPTLTGHETCTSSPVGFPPSLAMLHSTWATRSLPGSTSTRHGSSPTRLTTMGWEDGFGEPRA